MNNKITITLTVAPETIKAMDELKQRFKMNRSKLVRYIFTFFEHSPEQLDKILKWTKNYAKANKLKIN